MVGTGGRLSQRVEAAIVIVAAFGYFLFGAIFALFDGSGSAPITERSLEFLLIYEAVVAAILGAFLLRRGWTARRVGLLPTLIDSLIGFGLAAGFYVLYAAISIFLSLLNIQPAYLGNKHSLIAGHLSAGLALAVAAVNAAFEEIFVCGYIVTVAKEDQRLATGVNASVAIRLAYHLYQGGAGVVGIIPFGLMCAWWFARTGRLWPVMVAHAAIDATSLLYYSA